MGNKGSKARTRPEITVSSSPKEKQKRLSVTISDEAETPKEKTKRHSIMLTPNFVSKSKEKTKRHSVAITNAIDTHRERRRSVQLADHVLMHLPETFGVVLFVGTKSYLDKISLGDVRRGFYMHGVMTPESIAVNGADMPNDRRSDTEWFSKLFHELGVREYVGDDFIAAANSSDGWEVQTPRPAFRATATLHPILKTCTVNHWALVEFYLRRKELSGFRAKPAGRSIHYQIFTVGDRHESRYHSDYVFIDEDKKELMRVGFTLLSYVEDDKLKVLLRIKNIRLMDDLPIEKKMDLLSIFVTGTDGGQLTPC
jgi:hypothetical protein